MQPLISVIVPVYKVEDDLKRCLDSLCKQSLTDIEIILVDDASPDRCGEICDAYASKDARFRVLHNQKNQGLSVARNIGITNASCDWLMFVDSDDWVDKDFCKEAYECAVRYQADLVMFRFLRINDFVRNCNESDKRLIFAEESVAQSGYKTKFEAIDMLHELVGMAAWNKLYRKDLFQSISYPPGYYFEDEGTTYKLVWQASCVYYLDKVLYYKSFREGSITTLRTTKALHDRIEMSMLHYHDLLKWGYPPHKLDKLLKDMALRYCIWKKPDNSDEYYVFCANVLRNSERIPTHFTREQKVLFVLFKYCQPIFEWICSLYDKKVC